MTMDKSQINLTKLLTVLGAIPFVACAVAVVVGLDRLHVHYFALTYGAVIISFLCGMHWGLYLGQAHLSRTNLLITSNVIALLAWASLLFVYPVLQFVVQMLCVVVLLLIDRALAMDGQISRWFYGLRKTISTVVLVCMGVMAVMAI